MAFSRFAEVKQAGYYQGLPFAGKTGDNYRLVRVCVCVIMLLVGQSCGINRRLTTTYITIPSRAPERLLNAILYTLSGGWRAARRLIERIGNNYPAREAGCLRSNKMPVDEACNLTVLVCVWDSLLIYWLAKMSQNNLFFVV